MRPSRTLLLICTGLLAYAPAYSQGNDPAARANVWRQAGIQGKIDFYVSKMDGKKRPYAVCATSDSHAAKPLVVEVDPGARTDAGAAEVFIAEQYAWYAKKNGRECIVLRPTGRGPGSLYQNYGEVDALEAIENVVSKYPIDRDRITVIGSSMGGAAAWFLISHYPDLFAAGAPMAGYCDYRLWEKPGGYTFPLQPWEEPSWQARSAAFLFENFLHTPVWIVHGEWDRSVGGGVPVAHSREMFKRLTEKGFAPKYTELAKTGHSIAPDVVEPVLLWLLEQKKVRDPQHVALTTFWLRHNRSYWVTIDQLERYGRRASIDADRSGAEVVAKTENVRAFSIEPAPGARSVQIDGQWLRNLDPAGRWSFHRSRTGSWNAGPADLTREKHHGSSGPISDIFFDNLILVPGTVGTDEERFFTELAAANTTRLMNQVNGGLHRGGILGSNTVELESVRDVDLSEEQMRKNNLLLFGTAKSNSVLKHYRDKLRVAFDAGTIRLDNRTYSGERVAVFAVFPHPDNPGRYIAVHGGVTPDAITWGSHLSLQLLPDYVVYDRGRMLDWGFWDNTWRQAGN